MLDVAWPELVVIGAVALVAIGPKDLPKVMHALGQWAAKARRMLHDIHSAFDQLNYEAEVAEKLKKDEQEKAASSPPKPPEDHDRPAAP